MEFDPVALLSILDIPIGDLKVRQLRFPPPPPSLPLPFPLSRISATDAAAELSSRQLSLHEALMMTLIMWTL